MKLSSLHSDSTVVDHSTSLPKALLNKKESRERFGLVDTVNHKSAASGVTRGAYHQMDEEQESHS